MSLGTSSRDCQPFLLPDHKGKQDSVTGHKDVVLVCAYVARRACGAWIPINVLSAHPVRERCTSIDGRTRAWRQMEVAVPKFTTPRSFYDSSLYLLGIDQYHSKRE